MPYITMNEIWTPLKMLGIKFYKGDNGHHYIKVGKNRRRKLKF